MPFIKELLRRNRSLFTLLILAPAIPELLTGSTPFWKFLNPINLAILIVIYGFPAVLIRNYAVHRNLKYHHILLLGMLEGVLIEGLAVNTYYNPSKRSLGVFSTYGRFLGVNWNWALYLTFFHSIYSVLVPIMLVDSIYPEDRGAELASPFTIRWMLPTLAMVIILSNLFGEAYRPDPAYYILSFVFMALIWLLYRRFSDKPMLFSHLKFPSDGLYLYTPILLVGSFFGFAERIDPVTHLVIGVILYASL